MHALHSVCHALCVPCTLCVQLANALLAFTHSCSMPEMRALADGQGGFNALLDVVCWARAGANKRLQAEVCAALALRNCLLQSGRVPGDKPGLLVVEKVRARR